MFSEETIFELRILLRFFECHLHALIHEGNEISILVTDSSGTTEHRTVTLEVAKGLIYSSKRIREELDIQQIEKLRKLFDG